MSFASVVKTALSAGESAIKKGSKTATAGFKSADDAVRSSNSAIDAIHEIYNVGRHIDPVKNKWAPDTMKAVEEIASNGSHLMSEFDVRGLNGDELSAFIDLTNRAKKFDDKINVTAEVGQKSNALRQFEDEIADVKPLGGNPIGLAGDTPEAMFVKDVSDLANIAPDMETFYKGLSSPEFGEFFKTADDIVDRQSSVDRIGKYVDNNDVEKIAGFVEREAEFFDIQASAQKQASQISGIFGDAIKRSFKKGEDGLPIVLTYDEASILGTATAYKKVKATKEALEKIGSKRELMDTTFRPFGDVQKIGDFKKVIDYLEVKLEDQLMRRAKGLNIKEALVEHTGKSYRKMAKEGLFDIEKVDGRVEMSEAARYVLSQDDGNFNDMFRHVTSGAFKDLPENISKIDADHALSLISKAVYLNGASGRKIENVAQLVKYYDSLDNFRFGKLKEEGMLQFLSETLDPVLANKKYINDSIELINNSQFIVTSNSQLKKMLKNDFSLSKKVRGKINEATKSKIKGFTFSERGYTGTKAQVLNVDEFRGIKAISAGGGKVIGEETSKAASTLMNLLKDNNWVKNFTDKVTDVVPALRSLMKNYGLSGPTTIVSNKLKQYLNGVNAIVSDFKIVSDKVWIKSKDAEKARFIGHFQSGSKLDSKYGDLAVRYNALLEKSKKLDEELLNSNFYVDRDGIGLGSQVTRKSPGRLTKEFYEEVTDALTAKINKQEKVDLNKAVKGVLEDYNYTGKEFEDLMLAINDTINPFDTLQRRVGNQMKQLIQVGIVRELKDMNVFRTRTTKGFSKIPEDVVNPFFFEEVFGTKNIHLPRGDVEQITRVAREYSRLSKTTWAEMGKELNIQGNRLVRHNLISNTPATWCMAHTGNMMILAGNAGINPLDYVKRYKDFDFHLKNYTDRYQEFLSSGVATDAVLMGDAQKRFDHRSARTGVRNLTTNQRYNLFSPDSQVSNVMMYHLLEKPDKAARFIIWDELDKAGKSYDEIRQVMSTTMGFTDEVPKIINLFAEIPGGDIFARYGYTFTVNFFNTITKNPKQMVKTIGALAAIQTASMYLFLDSEERSALRSQSATWIKPNLFSALRGDPSFATPTGQYHAFSFASPWATSVSAPNESMNPFAQLIRASINQENPIDVMKQNSKLWRKASQGADYINNQEYGRAITSAAGVVSLDLESNKEPTGPSGRFR